ncbi:hypothetical protein HMPREF3293_00236 [Christensenella minuta]|uniref:Uncharacterized protein n=1 Tax=Christensenella minuta TaxID=626937 RepID=A0A136Q8E5_9FIRM|nr:hypothetical protein HMPREF3293_00236 [Christensenella minuta]
MTTGIAEAVLRGFPCKTADALQRYPRNSKQMAGVFQATRRFRLSALCRQAEYASRGGWQNEAIRERS